MKRNRIFPFHNRKQDKERRNEAYYDFLLKNQVTQFSKDLNEALAEKDKYLACDCLAPFIQYLDGESFEKNLENIFAQLKSGYLTGMYMTAKYWNLEKSLLDMKKAITSIERNIV